MEGNEQVLINQGKLDSPSLLSFCSRFVAVHRSLHDTAMTPTDSFSVCRLLAQNSSFRRSIPRIWIAGSNQQEQNGRWPLAQNPVSILRGARAADPAEHTRKVLLCFEPARHGDIKNPHLGLAQHLFCTLHPLPQDKLVRALARRPPKRLQEMRCAEPCTLGHFVKG